MFSFVESCVVAEAFKSEALHFISVKVVRSLWLDFAIFEFRWF
jgi:hypothetical protein